MKIFARKFDKPDKPNKPDKLDKSEYSGPPADYAVYRLNERELALYCVVCACGTMLVGMVFYRSVIIAALLLPAVIPGRKFFEDYMARRRSSALESQLRDFMYSLSASFVTGRHMGEAISECLESLRLIYPANAPIMAELAEMNRRISENREDEADLLKDFARRSGNEDITNFAEAYAICRVTGGDLEKMVNKSAGIIIEKIGIKNEIKTLTSQKRLESKILLAIPVVLLLFLQSFSEDYVAILYEGLIGRIIMTCALALTAFSYWWSLRLTRIDI